MIYSDAFLTDILTRTRTIALVGASAKPVRPSFGVMEYLLAKGYRVIPVNPGLAGQQLLGQTVVASLADIEEPVQMVDLFRNSEAALSVTEEALAQKDRLGIDCVWLQLGVINGEAEARAEAAGVDFVMDRCTKIEIARLDLTPTPA